MNWPFANSYDDKWEELSTLPTVSSRSKIGVQPFPFILTCLTVGASFRSEEGYFHAAQAAEFDMDFDEGDNNNGITVLDITDLDHVKYCFVD